MRLQELHERLLSWASAPPRDLDLLRAKREHFEEYGEPHEEDRSFEVRVNGMLDAYLYEFRLPGSPLSTVEGLEVEGAPAFSVQYHPEASPGPHDARPLFRRFVSMMEHNR